MLNFLVRKNQPIAEKRAIWNSDWISNLVETAAQMWAMATGACAAIQRIVAAF